MSVWSGNISGFTETSRPRTPEIAFRSPSRESGIPCRSFSITVRDGISHLDMVSALMTAGAILVEGPGVWPSDFCDEFANLPSDLAMHFATLEVSAGGLLVVAAPHRPGDQLHRFRAERGPDAIHHVAIHVEDIHAAAAAWSSLGWTPLSEAPAEDKQLRQRFFRNQDGQIIELISRPVGGRATFTCSNLKSLRISEVRR